MTWQGNIWLLKKDQYQPDIQVLHQEKEAQEKEEISDWGERCGQRAKDNEVEAIVIKPIRKIDAEVGDLACWTEAIRNLDIKCSFWALYDIVPGVIDFNLQLSSIVF